jgi:membrane associated rhomboid family serine protease
MVGFLPRWISPVVWALIGATLTISLTAAIVARNGFDAYGHLALMPSGLWAGEMWRLFTWTFVESSPWALVSGCIALYWFGGQLAGAWGARRFAGYVAAIIFFAGAGTAVLALLVRPAWSFPHLGGFALSNALVVAWALQFPERTIPVHVFLRIGGPVLAYGVVLMTVLYAAFYSVAAVLPELLAGGAALLYMSGIAGAMHRRVRSAFVQFRARRLGIHATPGGRHGGPFGPHSDN